MYVCSVVKLKIEGKLKKLKFLTHNKCIVVNVIYVSSIVGNQKAILVQADANIIYLGLN